MKRFIPVALALVLISCSKNETTLGDPTNLYQAINDHFSHSIDLDNLDNYANQSIPNFITKDNTKDNPITDKGATLGRILFFDKSLSIDNSIACASCHKQDYAFGDLDAASTGVNGSTARHSMRLVNSRFSIEEKFFWDERAATLEEQTTMPIQDHVEMGYSGQNGNPNINDLIEKLSNIDYYPEFFEWVYGDAEISEKRMQNAMAQFVRSIQSFDSKYDAGRSQAPNDGAPFNNFTSNENAGKDLFITPPNFDANGNRVAGGAGCAGCHQPPEFDIDPNTRNNGIIGVLGSPGQIDLTVTRAPSLRDVMNGGTLNGGMMHTAIFDQSMIGVINHYNQMPQGSLNPQLDNRLRPGGNLQNLNLTNQEKQQLVEFISTLSGSNIYTDSKWSDPF